MIEEIKKELLKLNIHECDIEDVFEILDKHNNQPDYKSAWNELKNKTNEELKQATWAVAGLKDTKISIEELETKYNLGGE